MIRIIYGVSVAAATIVMWFVFALFVALSGRRLYFGR